MSDKPLAASMRIAVLGDVGQPVYHVGDEAMTHAAVRELQQRGINDIIILTRNEDDSRRRFGTNTAPTLPFPWPPSERAHYLDSVLAALDTGQGPHDDAVGALLDTLSGCDALLIAGGGNMNSLYGWLLYERAAVAAMARSLGLPVVISGQTLGPPLVDRDRDVAAELLSTAALVGAREADSLTLARQLMGGRGQVAACLDDASFPVSGPDTTSSDTPYLAATFAGGTGAMAREDFVRHIAAVLDNAAALTGLRVVFLPHMATPGAGDGDEAMHREIAAAMACTTTTLRPIGSAIDTANITAGAELVLTSRYHPAVFAANAGIPCVGLAVENYSEVRLRGTLANWGAGTFTVCLPGVADGTFDAAVAEAWDRREELRNHFRSVHGALLDHDHKWWDAVVRGLQGELPQPPELPVVEEFAVRGPWASAAEPATQVFLAQAEELEALRAQREHLRGALAGEQFRAATARAELAAWLASRSFRTVRILAKASARIRRRKDKP